jgi:hypothetical protein
VNHYFAWEITTVIINKFKSLNDELYNNQRRQPTAKHRNNSRRENTVKYK